MINILEFTDIQKFLVEYWEFKRTQNSSFTVRAWSKQMGMSYHTPLYEMIKGKRKVYTSFVPLLINSLKLDEKAANHLMVLVDIQRAKDDLEKEHHLKRLNAKIHCHENQLIVSEADLPSFEAEMALCLKNLQAKYAKNDPLVAQTTIKIEVTLIAP